MFKLGRKILILALLLVMPLQGVAASLSHLLCSSPSGIENMNAGHHHGSNDAGPHQHDESTGSNDDSGHAGHSSCHQASPAIPSFPVAVFASDLPVFEPAIFFSPSLFFPEQPQRPPLA